MTTPNAPKHRGSAPRLRRGTRAASAFKERKRAILDLLRAVRSGRFQSARQLGAWGDALLAARLIADSPEGLELTLAGRAMLAEMSLKPELAAETPACRGAAGPPLLLIARGRRSPPRGTDRTDRLRLNAGMRAGIGTDRLNERRPLQIEPDNEETSVKLTPLALILGASMAAVLAAAPATAAPAYAVTKTVPLGAPDRWDYVVVDPDTGRVYVAHSDKLAVLDGRSGALVGQVEGIAGGTHGVAISHATGQGFTDDGRNGLAVAFDLKTLKVVKQIPADKDADAIARDPVTGRVFVMEGDPGAITVVEPKSDAAAAVIKAGEKLEYATGDGKGFIYVAGEEKRDLLKIDARSNGIVARWATPDCQSPHGLAVDAASRRAFMGCINSVMMVVDTQTGRVVAKLPIGRGSDAVAWDAKRKRAFSSNGADGTISVYQQVTPDRYEALETVHTQVSGRTMDVDPQTGRLFVAAAEVGPPAQPGGRPRPVPGTLKVLILDPVK